jgi:hypothetical protein
LYLGQDHHLAYPHHRAERYLMKGFNWTIQKQWTGLCSYTNRANGNYALCNVPSNTHAWRRPDQYSPGFICGTYTASLSDKFKAVAAAEAKKAGSYTFFIAKPTRRSGRYNYVMISTCKKYGMKPVCDHPSYCANDRANSLWIGQSGHLAYPGHRFNNDYFPSGFANIRDKWNGLCSYTRNSGSGALCNYPTNTHSWRNPSQYRPGFMCGAETRSFVRGNPKATCNHDKNSKPGAPKHTCTCPKGFTGDGKRIGVGNGCTNLDECKPRNPCGKVGKRQMTCKDVPAPGTGYTCEKCPAGYNKEPVKNWTGNLICVDTNGCANSPCSPNATCADVKAPGTGYKCGKCPNGMEGDAIGVFGCRETDGCAVSKADRSKLFEAVIDKSVPFTASLGGKQGVKSRRYTFYRAKISGTAAIDRNTKYSTAMIAECNKYGMMPVCDHRAYCRNDKKALYIGQDHHLAYKPHRNNNRYMPNGFSKIRNNWNDLCSYTANANGNYALCNIPSNRHAWRRVEQYNPGFICGGVFGSSALHKKAGADGKYVFYVVKASTTKGRYSTLMINECKKYGMKPVCDHPTYCKGDLASLYIGQKGHLAYAPHRNNNGMVPTGFRSVKSKWSRMCSYTSRYGTGALCNVPVNSHAWRNPAQYNPGFVCGAVAGLPELFDNPCPTLQLPPHLTKSFSVELGARNGVSQGAYTFYRVTKASQTGGRYDQIMVNDCKQFGMKPVCDHPNYCKNDKNSLYLGQQGHMAYRPHRVNTGYTPAGFAAVEHEWSGVCSSSRHGARSGPVKGSGDQPQRMP